MLLALFAWLLFAIFSAVGAGTKNRSGIGWFFIGLLFGPFGLLVFAMPKLEPEDARSNQQPVGQAAQQALPANTGAGTDWESPPGGSSNQGPIQSSTINGQPMDQGETICPMCREAIKIGALKCKHCGEMFSEPAGAAQ